MNVSIKMYTSKDISKYKKKILNKSILLNPNRIFNKINFVFNQLIAETHCIIKFKI